MLGPAFPGAVGPGKPTEQLKPSAKGRSGEWLQVYSLSEPCRMEAQIEIDFFLNPGLCTSPVCRKELFYFVNLRVFFFLLQIWFVFYTYSMSIATGRIGPHRFGCWNVSLSSLFRAVRPVPAALLGGLEKELRSQLLCRENSLPAAGGLGGRWG